MLGTGDGMVTQRTAPIPGMNPTGDISYARVEKDGPTIRVKAPSVVAYILLDVIAFNFVKGWGSAAAFYGAGSFELHADAPDGAASILWFITEKAILPTAVLAMTDLGVWLNKIRQARGIVQ